MKMAIHLRQLFFRFSGLKLFPASLKREGLVVKKQLATRIQ
jgi:hypothetical protein